MAAPARPTGRLIRFGTFELSVDTEELRNKGAKVKLERQPIRLLEVLLAHPGQLVTREDLKQELWPGDTFVDFDHSINVAVKRLREALNDSAATPRFIETLPRRGYRFIYPVNDASARTSPPVPAPRRWPIWAGLAAAGLLSVTLASNVGGMRDRILATGTHVPLDSVAVLPFKNLTGDAKQEWLADGITDDLTTELAQVKQLFVPSVTSTMTYKPEAKKRSSEIAKELRVKACVEGSVQRPAGRLIVNVQLVDGLTDRHVWADSYELDLAGLQPLMHRIARDLVRETKVSPTADQQTRLASARSLNPEAYQAYLLARQYGGTEAGRAKAEELLSRAVALDPSYAQAYAQLALLSAHGGNYLIGGTRRDRDQTRQLARKALELDGGLAEAHAALGWVEMSDWDWWSADEHFRRAIDLNPNLLVARTWYAEYLNATGRSAEALWHADYAMRMDPLRTASVAHAAQVYVHVGRVDDAIRVYRRLLDAEPGYWFAHQALGEAFTLKGMHRQAIPELEKALAQRGGDNVNIKGLLARAYVGMGEPERARQIAADFEIRAKTGPISAYGPVMAYLALGEHARALAWLEQAYDRHGEMMMMLNRPAFDPLRSDPRFQALVRRIGLPGANAGTGTRGGVPAP